jgi:hypothetical protein
MKIKEGFGTEILYKNKCSISYPFILPAGYRMIYTLLALQC